MRQLAYLLTIGLTIGTAFAAQNGALSPLLVEDVVDAVRKRYPPLLAALADREIADAEVLAAEGRFDTTLRTRVDTDSFGFYANRRADAGIEQPLAWQGMSAYSGYRVGDGDFAPYDGKLATRSLGEWRSGLKFPLLRDREIDSRRGELQKARIGRRLASLGVEQQKLTLLQTAIFRYWNWVAMGRRLAVTREVLAVAETRQKLLEEGARAGQIPRIDAVDNQRAILNRRAALVDAERAFQQAAIELSLYYRDANGDPALLGAERFPARASGLNQVPVDDFEADREVAFRRRPEIGRLAAQTDQNQVDVRMARNATRAALDLTAGFFYEGGTAAAVKRGPQELRAGLALEFPLQNRAARGRQLVAETKGKQLAIREGFLRDQIAAEVKDAQSALRAAYERLRLLGEEVRVSRELEEAERTRFELGEGTLFVLNQREQATLDSAVREAIAEADYQRARSAHEYATGVLLDR